MEKEYQYLPPFPAKEDVWTALEKENRPIVVYGMGNGADKLLLRFAERKIEVADFFASDGFVRGHSFHGKRVLSFSEIKEKYEDFHIVLSFASNRAEVLSLLYAIDGEYDMTMPDLPVVGEDTFTKEFYNEHEKEIKASYDLLFDEASRRLFGTVLSYKLSGKIGHLRECLSTPAECYAPFRFDLVKTAIDAGAYNGDTAEEMLGINPNISHIVAIEPDKRNFKKLSEKVSVLPSLHPINAAVADKEGITEFSASGNRNSTLNEGSYKKKVESVPLITVDSLALSPDYIKYDVEGAEEAALIGSKETIRRSRPFLTVSLYHRNEDIFALPLLSSRLAEDYRFYLKRTPSLPAWELRLICVPTEKSVSEYGEGENNA